MIVLGKYTSLAFDDHKAASANGKADPTLFSPLGEEWTLETPGSSPRSAGRPPARESGADPTPEIVCLSGLVSLWHCRMQRATTR